MNFQQLDTIADLCNPLLIVALILLAFATLKNRAWSFLLCNGLAVVIVQQLSKYAQKKEIWGENFPSTHFAVALVLCVGLVFLKRRFWPFALAYLAFYSGLMLYIHYLNPRQYHTPMEMLGSFFAIPVALLFHFRRKKTRPVAN